MKFCYGLMLFIYFTLSCQTDNSDSTASDFKQDAVNELDVVKSMIGRVGFLELPYSQNILSENIDSKWEIYPESMDTLVFGKGTIIVAGALPDTSTYYCFLYYLIGDLQYPHLITLDKQGNLIDDLNISLGICGLPVVADTSINEFTISKELQITSNFRCKGKVYTEDSMERTEDVDMQKEAIGQISKRGKIYFTIKEK